MTYGETSQVKTDLGISGSAFDTRLTDWNDKASIEWDDVLYQVASRRRRITDLPELPLQASEVTETDRDGTNNLIKARYFDNMNNFDQAKHFRDVARGIAEKRIERLKADRKFYGRVVP